MDVGVGYRTLQLEYSGVQRDATSQWERFNES